MQLKRSRTVLACVFLTNQLWTAEAKTIHYELTASKEDVNVSGKKAVSFALMLNGQIPAPTLEFTEGDIAEIVVHNKIADDELSIHWHGLLLPSEMDGVPYVTTPPIKSGESYTFTFTLRQSGTYWYHSHTNVQEQKGLYGAFIVHPKKRPLVYDKDVVVVISDWSDEDALDILRNLRKDGDYYLYKKDTVRSWFGAAQAGQMATYLDNEWTRMGGMDYSDVGYDAFLINGKKETQLAIADKGDKVRVRIINASASTYFTVSLADQQMQVVSADGIDVMPVTAQEILIGMAETYDLIFELPEQKNYELRATAQDGTGFATGWLGEGVKVAAADIPAPGLYEPMHIGHNMHHMTERGMDHSMHGGHHHASSTVKTLTVDDLKALTPITYDRKQPVHDITMVLDGDMGRYVWYINGKAIFQDRTVFIKENEIVRFTFVNKTMMHHPMHLHGHFFRVMNKYETFSPLKHTVDVGPHSSRVIEFVANEPGEWMLHCHNLYHLKSGMARVIKYSSYKPSVAIQHLQHHDPHLHDHTYFFGHMILASNHATGHLRLSQTWNQIDLAIEGSQENGKHFYAKDWDVEGDLFFRRWLDQYTNVVVGGVTHDQENSAVVGLSYMLPLLIDTTVLLSHRGKVRFDAQKEFQWTKNIQSELGAKWRQEEEEVQFDGTLMFRPVWQWGVGVVYKDLRWSVAGEFFF